MEPYWGVIIGSAIGSLILAIVSIIKGMDVKRETKGYAIASIILGSLFIIPFVCFVGLLLGVISYRKTEWKKLSIVGIVISGVFSLMYFFLLLGKLTS
ncbi:unnamed protein product [marine sediment metagenome]|uniref:Uncharacterized protein n=1 Tax=marine sediment metagenome TaxID=412755 RepID=X0WQW7_9ZZZZ